MSIAVNELPADAFDFNILRSSARSIVVQRNNATDAYFEDAICADIFTTAMAGRARRVAVDTLA